MPKIARVSKQDNPPRTETKTLWATLSGVDLRLIDEIRFLSDLQAKKSPTGATYCMPGRKYLAAKLSVSVRTISRHVAKLASLGVLAVTQRRPQAGHYSTNLYRLSSNIAWCLARIVAKIANRFHRGPKKSHIAPSREGYISPEARKEEIAAILKAWQARTTS